MSFYGDLGLRRVVNAATTFTAVGGSLMPPEVLAAMTDAASSFVDMHELHAAAGHRLAGLTGNEAAHVTAGCGAAIVLSVLACATGGDPAAIARMPGTPVEVVVHAAHRIPYDPAITLTGATIVQVGNVLQTFEWELDAAITDRTAAVFYVAGSHLPAGALDLATTVEIAHARGRAGDRGRRRATPAAQQSLALHPRGRRRPGPVQRRQGSARTAGQRPDRRQARARRGGQSECGAAPATGPTHEGGQGGDRAGWCARSSCTSRRTTTPCGAAGTR